MHLPLVLPPVVIGYFLLLMLGRRGPVGAFLDEHFGIVFAFRWTGAAIACAVMGFPLMVRAIRLSLEAVDEKLEAAARTLGAGRMRVLATITLPLALPGVITGTLLSFARSLGEFGATITFVSNIPGETRTLPLAIYTYHAGPGRRRVGDAAEPDRGRRFAGGAARIGNPRAAGDRGDEGQGCSRLISSIAWAPSTCTSNSAPTRGSRRSSDAPVPARRRS